jgi:hypothetical protein
MHRARGRRLGRARRLSLSLSLHVIVPRRAEMTILSQVFDFRRFRLEDRLEQAPCGPIVGPGRKRAAKSINDAPLDLWWTPFGKDHVVAHVSTYCVAARTR